MHEDTAIVSGEFTLELFDPGRELKDRVVVPNLLVTTGKEGIADQMAKTPTLAVPKFIAIGTGSTAAAAGNTALVTEVKRKEATTRTRSGAVLTLSVEFAAGEGTGSLREAGVLTASSGGTLYSRTVFEALGKEAGDALIATWALTIA